MSPNSWPASALPITLKSYLKHLADTDARGSAKVFLYICTGKLKINNLWHRNLRVQDHMQLY